MPILDIEIVASEPDLSLPAGLAQTLANAAAQVFGARPGTVWVKLRLIPPAHYAENGGKPEDVYPVFATVIKSRVPEGSALEDEISLLTHTLASTLKRPEGNIHIFYQPDGASRAAFGGKLVR